MANGNTIDSLMKPATIIDESATLKEALARMNKEKTNTVLVVDAEGKLAGEVSITDLLNAVVPESLDGDAVVDHFANEERFAEAVRASADREVSDFMSMSVESVRHDASMIDVAATAISMGQAIIPVVDADDHPVGIISRQGLKHILSTYLGLKDS